MSNKKITPLSRELTNELLEVMRLRLTNEFGVTLQEDHNGAWGPAGARYVTLRFGDPMIEVHMEVISIRDTEADEQQLYEEENPQ